MVKGSILDTIIVEGDMVLCTQCPDYEKNWDFNKKFVM